VWHGMPKSGIGGFFPWLNAEEIRLVTVGRKEMADTEFKNRPIAFESAWTNHSNGTVIGRDQYKPDLSFKNADGKVVCVIESASTNDRKVAVGEMCQADKFFSDQGVSGVLIFSLCGRSKYPPTPELQIAYLRPYFEHLTSAGRGSGLKEVYSIKEADFEIAQWKALSPAFLEKCSCLKAQQCAPSDPSVAALPPGA